MRIRVCLALLPLVLATACGREPPTPEQLEDAKARVDLAVLAAHQARMALELLGLLPVYTCGEPRRTFVGKAADGVHAKVACVTATTKALGDTEDAVVLSFPDNACTVRGHVVSGHADFLYNGGEERMDVFADLRDMKVDGQPLQAKVGYGTCGDERRFWTEAAGELPGRTGSSYSVNGRVGLRDGLPIIGGTSLVFDGPGQVTGPEGTTRLTFTGMLYELGDYAPKEGEALLEEADGGKVKATFSSTLWRLGKMELVIDDNDPVTVPIVQ